MTQVHFIVEESPEGGYLARAVGVDIFTEADDLAALHDAGSETPCIAISMRRRCPV